MTWAKESGLIEDNLRCTRNEAILIQNTLYELQSLLSDTEKLKKRYKLDLRHKDHTSISRLELDGAMDETETFARTSIITAEERASILRRMKLVKNASVLPKRLFWAACDKENMRDMVQAAHGFIDQLSSHLEQQQQRQIQSKLDTAVLTNIDLTSRVEDLASLMTALNAGLNGQPHVARDAGSNNLENIIQTKTLRLELGVSDDDSISKKSTSTSEDAPINLDPGKLKRSNDSESPPAREIAVYGADNVYVEWKTIKDRRQIRKLKPRIQALCKLLRAPKSHGFRALKCRGLIELVGKDVFGMVYDFPKEAAGGSGQYRLRDAYGFAPCRPSASSRKRLALELSTTVLLLHTAGWVHKGIRSANILYFKSQLPNLPDDTDEILKEPWLMGYEYARFDNPDMMSELQSSEPGVDIYRHPDILGGEPCSFMKEHDIYAFGLVLLEIGFWCPLVKIIKGLVDVEKEPASSAFFEIKDFVLGNTAIGKENFILQQLRFYMGDVYADIVKKCLEGEGFEDSVASFKQTVVQVLADMIL